MTLEFQFHFCLVTFFNIQKIRKTQSSTPCWTQKGCIHMAPDLFLSFLIQWKTLMERWQLNKALTSLHTVLLNIQGVFRSINITICLLSNELFPSPYTHLHVLSQPNQYSSRWNGWNKKKPVNASGNLNFDLMGKWYTIICLPNLMNSYYWRKINRLN